MKMARKKIRREVPISRKRRLDIKMGNIAREEQPSGSRQQIRKVISRLKTQKNAKKELGVRQGDTPMAIEEVRKSHANIRVTNLVRTKRIKP